jgi:hypothetical protein
VSSDICRLVGDSLSFKSESVSKGAMADMVIQKNLGQALTGQNLIVFQVVSFLKYKYKYMFLILGGV